MPKITSFASGNVCYADLATVDQHNAKRFYTKLLGWTYEDRPLGDDAAYSKATLRNEDVAAIFTMDGKQAQAGMPPHWLTYVAVRSADEAAARTKALGGKVVMPPFDVMDAGRMALIADPGGAMLALWQAKTHRGATLMNEPGTLCWSELVTDEVDRVGKFYVNLFDWRAEASLLGGSAYTTFHVGERSIAGMLSVPPEMGRISPHWLVYFAVGDCDLATTQARALGGSVLMAPTDIPNIGRVANLRDPQGAAFAVIKLV